MALMLIDVGNSAVKSAVATTRDEVGPAQVEVHRGRVKGLRDRLLLGWERVAVDVAIACSVAAPDVVAEVEAAVRARGWPLRWLQSEPHYRGAFSLANAYRDPRQLGADRWHALIGACARQAGSAAAPLVVVTAGTASTVDCVEVVDGGWRFIGGVIAPGVRLMLESLARGAAGLPRARGAAVDFPDHTDDAIASGVLDAQAGLVQRVQQRFAARLGTRPRLLLGGGHAESLAPLLKDAGLDPTIEHNLVLRGLLARIHGET